MRTDENRMRKEMEEKRLFQIGDVAKMFQISVGSLRHYEKKGLLAPEYTDPETGYRYYSVKQFEILNTIRYLRVLDMPLEQIAEFLQNRDIPVIEEKLLRQKEMITQKQRQLRAVERKIDHRLMQIEDARNSELNRICIQKSPTKRVVFIKASLRPRSYLDLEYSIRQLEAGQTEPMIFLGKVGVGISKENLLLGRLEQYDLVFLLLDEEDAYEGKVEELEEGKCLSIRFCGSHKEAPLYYEKLLREIEKEKLEITGFSREITLIDYGITGDTDKFVTEIQIPVK